MSKRLNMSNDEAVEWLLSLKNLDICGENRKTAIDKAVTALKAQPCNEDYPTCTECEHYDSEKHYCPRFCQVIKDTLAEAQPTEGDLISREDVITALIDADWIKTTAQQAVIAEVLNKIPSVKPKKGKWIYKWMKGQFCSECDEQSVWKFNYCPNCGAEMEVEDEANN